MWGRVSGRPFQASPEAGDGRPDPLNRWSQRLIDDLAARFGALGLYPFGGPPHWPFQRWAQRAESVWPSPIGMLIHPDHGLWHAYRGALAFAEPIDLPDRVDRPSPCEGCTDKPCLTTCPVGAFTTAGYDVPACAAHIAAAARPGLPGGRMPGAAGLPGGAGRALRCRSSRLSYGRIPKGASGWGAEQQRERRCRGLTAIRSF